MKTLIVVALLSIASAAIADGPVYRPTYPGTNAPDYSQPAWRVEPTPGRNGYSVQPTYPGTSSRDYSRPGYRVEGGSIYQTVPGTNTRDYQRRGWKLDD